MTDTRVVESAVSVPRAKIVAFVTLLGACFTLPLSTLLQEHRPWQVGYVATLVASGFFAVLAMTRRTRNGFNWAWRWTRVAMTTWVLGIVILSMPFQQF